MQNLYIHQLSLDDDAAAGSPAFGDPQADYMIIDLAPGISREFHRRFVPYSMTSMQVVKSIVQKLESMDKSVYLTHLVKEPVNLRKKVPIRVIRNWLPILKAEIESVAPRRILVLGSQTAEALIEYFNDMRSDHGCLFRYNFDSDTPHAYIVPTYRFSEGTSDPLKNPIIRNDIKRWVLLDDPTPPVWTELDSLNDLCDVPYAAEVYVDVETTGLTTNDKITMLGICWADGNGDDVIRIAHNPTPGELASFHQYLNEQKCHVTFHNAPFDLMMISANMKSPDVINFDGGIGDTMLAAHVSGEYIRNLKHLTSYRTTLPGPHAGGGWEDPEYLAEDVRSTRAIREYYRPIEDSFAYKILMRMVVVATDMRLRGVHMDRNRLTDLLHTKSNELIEMEEALVESFPMSAQVNWNSPTQVAQLLLNYGVPLTEQTKTGNISVSEPVLLALLETLESGTQQHRLLSSLLDYRATSKLVSGFLSSYLEELDEQGCIHPNLKLHGTTTGRLSCANPNIQQIPRTGEFKLCFIPRIKGGYYGLIDLAQAELRVAALLSNDTTFANALLDGDVHASMAKIAFPNIIPADTTLKEVKQQYAGERKASKSTTFGLVYGGSAAGLAHRNGLPVQQVKDVFSALEENCPDLWEWLARTKAEGVATLKSGTIFGNLRDLTREMVYEGKGGVERKAVNTPVQGVASYLTLIILSTVDEELKRRGCKSRPIFTVHDSAMIEIAPGEIEVVYECVQLGFKAMHETPLAELPLFEILPITGDLVVGESWAHVEDTNENGEPIWSGKCSSHQMYEYTPPESELVAA